MSRGNPDNLRRAAHRKSEATTRRAELAIRELVKTGARIDFRSVARHAECSPDFLYRSPELRPRIEHLRAQQQEAPAPTTARNPAEAPSQSNVVRALAEQLTALKRRHRDEVRELRDALAAAQGEILELRRALGPRATRARDGEGSAA